MATLRATLLFSLVALAGCRTAATDGGGAGVKEATDRGFEYDNITFDLIDVDGAPVPDVSMTFSSFHWSYQLFHAADFIPIPVYDPKWVEKKGKTQVIGITNANGHAESGPFSIHAAGILPGNSPASFSLGYFDQLPKPCKNLGGGVYGLFSVGALKLVSSVPEMPSQHGACGMTIKAAEDTYRTLALKCQSSLTAAAIASARQTELANCSQ